MDAERWQRLSPHLDVLLELSDQDRQARLQALRRDDPALADALEALLALEEDTTLVDNPLLPPRAPDLRGRRVGPYRLEEPLGEGGMGTVWRAQRADGLYQRQVALKLLRPGLADPGLLARFSREREILARLAHAHIARLLDAGIDHDGQPYLALEYVEGEPITAYCQRTAVPLEDRLALFQQVCEAVSHAHANLVVHRDLKPSNILVTPEGQVRLLDFGIAKLLDDSEAPDPARTEVRAFTLHYAAPEQIRGEPVSTRTDVYSLGVVLYELLAGDKPYRLRRQSDAEWERAILAVEPQRPSQAVLRQEDAATPSPERRRLARRLRGDLDNIVLKALAKPPEQRYPSVEAMALDVQRHRTGQPVQARPQSLRYQARKYLWRHRLGLALGGLTTLALLAAVGVSLWQARQALRQAERAQTMQDFVIGLFDNTGNRGRSPVLDTRRLLAEGERRGERELVHEPQAHAELLGVMARLYVGLGDYPHALALLEKQARLLRALGEGAPWELQLASAAQHGRVLRLLGRSGECVTQMQALAPAPSRRAAPPSPQARAEFMSQYGRCRRLQGQREQARPLFEQALALRRQAQDAAGVAESMFDLALLQNDQGRAEEAVAAFRGALAYLQQHEGPSHPLAVEILRSLGLTHRNLGNSAAAMQAYDQALALAMDLHGPEHPVTLALRRQRVAVQVDLGQYAQAEAAMHQLLRQTEQTLGAGHRDVALAWNSMGIIALERGHLDQALEAMERALAIWRLREGDPQLAGGLFNRAMALHVAGRGGEALGQLHQARTLRVAQFGASHPVVGETDRMIGEVIASTDPAAAAPWLARAAALTEIGYGAQDPRSLFAQLTQSRNQARLDPHGPALARLDRLARLPGGGSEIPKLRWQAQAYAAEARCARGERRQALAGFDVLQAALAQQQPDGGLIPREVARLRADCAAGPTAAAAPAPARSRLRRG